MLSNNQSRPKFNQQADSKFPRGQNMMKLNELQIIFQVIKGTPITMVETFFLQKIINEVLPKP
jgi:hypothetical protein